MNIEYNNGYVNFVIGDFFPLHKSPQRKAYLVVSGSLCDKNIYNIVIPFICWGV